MTTTLLIVAVMATTPKPLITIDDGPHYRHHVRTLQLLQRHNVKAIWFVNGHFLTDKKNRTLLRKLYRLGHTVGQHTFSHRKPCSLTARQFRIELSRTERIVNRVLGRPQSTRMKVYRPPFGQKCHTGLARRLGYRVLYWHRADLGSTAASIIKTVQRLHRRKPPKRAILLFHYHNHKLLKILRTFCPIP